MSDEDQVTQAAKAIKGIVEAVPVYQDVVQPAAKQLGKGLETVAKTVHVALAPVSALVWGYDKIKEFVESKVTEKLKSVPTERIQPPSLLVAGPLLESLRYAGHEETLSELYANLLATSIDTETAHSAHPGFVSILQNMSPDEAKIMRLFSSEGAAPIIDIKAILKPQGFRILVRNYSFIGKKAGCEHPVLAPNYLDNLIRLGLLEVPPNRYILAEGTYEQLSESEELNQLKEQIKASEEEMKFGFDKKKIELTDLGKQFCMACVIDKGLKT